MSIEQMLERIAAALEKIAVNGAGIIASPDVKPAKAAKTTAAAAPVAASKITKDQLFDKLKEHGAAFGLKSTKALMVKHGADATNTTTASVPLGSYEALFGAAQTELNTKGTPEEPKEVFA